MQQTFLRFLAVFLKGFALGSANVIPGVSGGTIALITNIFERLINSIKSFDITAARLLIKADLKGFIKHTDLKFLLTLFAGIVTAVITLARLFEFLFAEYPVHIWSFFFGLILASIYFVGKTVNKWNAPTLIALTLGLSIALSLAFTKPAAENSSIIYLILSGVAGICSMILPGLSGSFVLIIMGNYQLIVIDAVNNFRLDILIPVGIGAVLGLVFFAHLLAWLLARYKDRTIALLTGFIAGSLAILWPWKQARFILDDTGIPLLKDGRMIVSGYQWLLPEPSTQTALAVTLIFTGIASIILIETLSTSGPRRIKTRSGSDAKT